MKRLYQWLRQRATHRRPGIGEREARQTTRTEVTVHEHQQTVLLAGAVGGGGLSGEMDRCPLCGQALAPVAFRTSGDLP